MCLSIQELKPQGEATLVNRWPSSLHAISAWYMNNIEKAMFLAISSRRWQFSSDLPVLTNIVQSHHTLEELQIGDIIIDFCSDYSTNLLQLMVRLLVIAD